MIVMYKYVGWRNDTMYLVPTPQKVEKKSEVLRKRAVKLTSEIADLRILKAMEKLPCDDGGIPLYITYSDTREEGYRICVSNEKITVDGDGINGAFYGIQTLRQIFENKEIFCVEIEDKPKNEFRILYHDVTRGRVPTVDSMKKLIDDLAYYKLNQLQFYMEHAYPFREMHGTLSESNCLLPEEIKELDAYCHENFIDFVPSLATCGHMYDILSLPQNAHLREVVDYKPKYTFWYERMIHHTINPSHPDSFDFVKSLIDQYIENFTSEYVNICGDEPFDLARGMRKAAGVDVDELYFEFMIKVINYIKSKGKKVMMWADQVFLDNMERTRKLPEDIIMLCWGYDSVPPEERVSKLEGTKFKKLVCPSSSSFYRLVENKRISEKNIQTMAQYGAKYNADGMMNTNWGDYGHPCSVELSMFGIVLGAQKSWDFEAPVDEELYRAMNLLLYKNDLGIEYLTRCNLMHEKAVFVKFVRYYSNLTHEYEVPWSKYPSEENLREAAAEAKKIVVELSQQKWEEDEFRLEMIVAAEGTAVIAELMLKHMGIEIKRWTDTEKWLEKYRTQWLKRNKESELFRIEELFRHMEEMPPQNKIFTYYGPEMNAVIDIKNLEGLED